MNGKAQDYILKGSVLEDGSNLPLRGVNLKIKASRQGTTTNGSGEFTLLLDSSLMNGLTLQVQHLGFDSREITLSPKDLIERTQKGDALKIWMTSYTYPLDTAIILSDPLPEIVYSSTKHNVADYDFIGEYLLVLVYPRRIEKGATLYLMNRRMEVQDSMPLANDLKAQGLRKDYADRMYLEASNRVFSLEWKEDDLKIHEVDARLFSQSIAPVIDTVEHSLYFSTQGMPFPAIEYYDLDRRDSLYALLRQVADKFMMELCRAEYKYLNTRDKLRLYRLELETGVEKEVLACIASFEEGLYYEPIYAPLFIWQDTLFLFDHVEGRLWIYDKESQLQDSLPINYHQPNKVMGNPFTQELVMDEVTGHVYAIFQKPGGRCWLERVDKETGRTEHAIQIKYRYPTAIQVMNGEVYYLYRPFESTQKKFLYKERL
ncbi:MAG: carboxypeptidase-like regulatory domain-containing protein [Bacteroidetes bacterium]|nr:carboxypeptidase-like regulatory domain-containing protein [Bacteroidota bacterium]